MEDNFFSMNKMMELSMSMAIAQQMVKTMNDATSNMQLPTSMPNINTRSLPYYVAIDGKQHGPCQEQEIVRLIIDGKINSQTYVWKPGMPSWDIAEKISEIQNLFTMVPPPLPPIK